jgi:hypothetical protein
MQNLVKKNSKWLLALSMVLVLVLGAVGTVSAAEFPKGETIPAGETIEDDVFISGENVVVDGTINGMLFASGAKVTLNGTVTGDVLLVGETIVVSESAVIDGNLFIAGADLTVNGQVTGSVFGGSSALELGSSALIGRNMYYGGFSLNTTEGSKVSKDLFAAAYQAILSGAIDRDLSYAGAAVELNNAIGRNATLDIGNVEEASQSNSWIAMNPYVSRYVDTVIQPGIRVSDSASIAGKLNYTSSVDVTNKLDSVTSGSVVYQTPVPYENQEKQSGYKGNLKDFDRRSVPGALFGAAALGIVRNFLKLFALGAIALWLFANPFKKLTDAAYAEPLKSIGWGFVLIAIGCLAIFIVPLAFVLVGILLGFLSLGSLLYFWFGIVGTTLLLAFMLFFFAVFTLSKILAAYLFGKWVMKGLFKQETEKRWLSLLLGVFLYTLIRAIPIIGWLAALTAALFGMGAFWLAYLQKKPIQ